MLRLICNKLEKLKEKREYERLYSLILRNVIVSEKGLNGKAPLQVKK